MVSQITLLLLFTLSTISLKNFIFNHDEAVKLHEDFQLEHSSSDNTDRSAEHELNCYYIKAINQEILNYLMVKKEDQNTYKSLSALGKALYNLFYVGRKHDVDRKEQISMVYNVAVLKIQWNESYVNDTKFPANNFGYFFYKNKQYCIPTANMSMLLYMYVDNKLFDDKAQFLNDFLSNLYDGDEEIYQLFKNQSKVKYSDLYKIDNTNAFKRFITFNYSVLLNKSADFIKTIIDKDLSEKANILKNLLIYMLELLI